MLLTRMAWTDFQKTSGLTHWQYYTKLCNSFRGLINDYERCKSLQAHTQMSKNSTGKVEKYKEKLFDSRYIIMQDIYDRFL